MTKNLLILSLFILAGLKINAQCIPDNTITKPGFYPKTLPDAIKGKPYSEIIQFKIIKDTVVDFGGPQKATIDSAHIKEVIGMPDGLTFKLNKTRPVYTPEEVGCALVSGTATKIDTFRLTLKILFYAKVAGFSVAQTQNIDNFKIVVTGTGGFKDLVNSSKLIYPNPLTSDKLTINPELVMPGTVIKVYNCQGQLLASQMVDNTQQPISFTYPKGIYYLSLENGNKVSRVKLVKE